MIKIIKYLKSRFTDVKKCYKTKQAVALFIVFMVWGCILINKQYSCAKTRELYTSLIQKSNPVYNDFVNNGTSVAYKIKIKKKSIVIHGSLSDSSTEQVTGMGIHTYKLSDNVKYISRGGEAPDQEFTKNKFKKYLEKCKDSALTLILGLEDKKVTKVIISS